MTGTDGAAAAIFGKAQIEYDVEETVGSAFGKAGLDLDADVVAGLGRLDLAFTDKVGTDAAIGDSVQDDVEETVDTAAIDPSDISNVGDANPGGRDRAVAGYAFDIRNAVDVCNPIDVCNAISRDAFEVCDTINISHAIYVSDPIACDTESLYAADISHKATIDLFDASDLDDLHVDL
ncbi:MAG: hypothetical protein AAF439_11945, partial [Pseudomonadota bacterium]